MLCAQLMLVAGLCGLHLGTSCVPDFLGGSINGKHQQEVDGGLSMVTPQVPPHREIGRPLSG